MSWIKNKLNKLLNKDEDYYEDYEENESYDDQSRQVPIHDHRQQAETESSTRKTSFRFPLIADDAPSQPQQSTYEQEPIQQPEERRFELPRHLQQPQHSAEVYDVEVSGIRDLLERRQKGRGHSTVIRSKQEVERTAIVSRAEREILTEKPVREERVVDQKFVNPLENRKRFVPTDVPSPVHGFKQPTPIEKLLKSKPEPVKKEQTAKIGREIERPAEPIHEIPKEQPRQAERQVEPKEALDLGVEVTELKPTSFEPQQSTEGKELDPVIQEQQVHHDLQLPSFMKKEPATQLEVNQVSAVAVVEKLEENILEEPQPIRLTLEEDSVQSEQEVASSVAEKVEEIKESPAEATVEPAPVQDEAKMTAPEVIAEPEVIVVSEPITESDPIAATEPVQVPQVQHVIIENSTIHIEQLHVENMPQAESMPQPVAEAPVAEPKNEGTRLPFNVLMLKSDKQKLIAQKIASEQFRQAKPKSEPEEVAKEVETPTEEVEAFETEQLEEVVASTVELPQLEAHEVSAVAEQPLATERPLEAEPVTNPVELAATIAEPVAVQAPIQDGTIQLEFEAEYEEIKNSAVEEEPVHILKEAELQHVEQPVIEIIEPIVKAVAEVQQEVTVAEVEVVAEPEKKRLPYRKPPMEFLLPPEEELEDREWMEEQGEHLVEALSHFQIAAQIESIVQGPAVTQFEITVGHGTKVSKVRNLSDDIKLALAAKDVRIDAPIPGKRSIGIEIPNRISRAVRLSEVTNSEDFIESDSPLEAALGLDLTGKPVTLDLRKMPHGLVAGATGSGKSVCINSILVSLLYKADPNELKLLLIDPKMVELAPFNHIPHLVSPVITDVKAATAALKWAVEEMERRYQLFMHSGQRHITGYNKTCEKNKQYAQKMPYILIVIDELADLMMMAPQDVEDAICRIAQKARACGIHLIIATQRPSVDVITGLIKSNIPTRIAFAVSSQIDSRTIIDGVGAERLLGRGDMLYMGNGMSAPVRIQGTFVTDEEIEEIIEFVREQGEPDYLFQQEELLKKAEAVEEQDELFEEVCRYVFEQGSASTSAIQRRYHIGYNRAARLVDMLERHRFVSEQKGSKPRDVFITETDLAHHFGG